MGMVFGKTGVAEPEFGVLYQRMSSASSSSDVAYEIRKYGERFAAETTWISDTGSTSSSTKSEDDKPFTLLAKYIGVFGKPENDGNTPISMTAPVMKQTSTTTGSSGIAIAMTAPVMKGSDSGTNEKSMMFVLPNEYKTLEMIPKPTNPAVHIVVIPPAVGAVYQYSGSMDDEYATGCARKLAEQLRVDGATEITDEYAKSHYQFWGYNPPFTLPMFRPNEVWLELTEDQVDRIVNKGKLSTDAN